MSESINTGETRRSRLSDGQAFGLLAAYLIFRTITNRVGLGVGPKLLKANVPWVIPLLNNSSLLLIQSGTGTNGRPGLFAAAVLASVFMSTVAGMVLYWAGFRFGHRLSEMSQRPGSPWAGVWNPKQIARAERWMDRWGVFVVFFGRVVEYFTLPVLLVAGASEMRFRRFLVANTLGGVAFACTFLWIGGAAQQRWPWLRGWISNTYGPWALRIGFVLLALVVIIFLLGRLQDRKQAQDSTTTPSQGPSDSSPSTD